MDGSIEPRFSLEVGAPAPPSARVLEALAARLPDVEDLEVSIDHGTHVIEARFRRGGAAITVAVEVEPEKTAYEAVDALVAALGARR